MLLLRFLLSPLSLAIPSRVLALARSKGAPVCWAFWECRRPHTVVREGRVDEILAGPGHFLVVQIFLKDRRHVMARERMASCRASCRASSPASSRASSCVVVRCRCCCDDHTAHTKQPPLMLLRRRELRERRERRERREQPEGREATTTTTPKTCSSAVHENDREPSSEDATSDDANSEDHGDAWYRELEDKCNVICSQVTKRSNLDKATGALEALISNVEARTGSKVREGEIVRVRRKAAAAAAARQGRLRLQASSPRNDDDDDDHGGHEGQEDQPHVQADDRRGRPRSRGRT